ncbi:FHA domain-containing protein [Rosistilla oblonga]|uniref:FHA domain protein n=1 Tax=Rosistilla oblonga TaxID=2527990 RepID=A0A518IME6_9BACT|nr:FHA domain-containing protein [Rosistilla oblonga]QDV54254.1 FHA domain protein [Rosistilla oblonga]|eukprot:TRINITY_DN35754_c0_g1_i1.p1 TRINITY_DN35754_c0_g1~~TRINITY_DN35754_c0_g1_i1.p1  ORF type:complete len:230 (-),score=42.97 TRINITY_DN35754_c0_g1_i1:60-749(-)
MQVKLKVLSGSHAGREISVSQEKFLIGRNDQCQLRPKSESVSRKHCILVQRDGKLLIQDLKSRNGTFVNGKRLPPDRAKALKPGDALTVGKLEFEVLVEYGLGGAKKPEVVDVKDAAQRTVNASGDDSKFEEVDINSWLDEADNIERVRKLGEPETRQMNIDASKTIEGDEELSGELSVGDGDSKDESGKRKPPEKKPPQKLPSSMKKQMSENSRDAAGEALKKFFSGR